jgi:hypothetical protein
MCEMYGQDPSDPDSIDNILDMISEESEEYDGIEHDEGME